MLKHVADNAAPLVSLDPSLAEAIVRLHRRVEAQLAPLLNQAGGLSQTAAGMRLPHVHVVDMNAMAAQQSLSDDLTKAMHMHDAASAGLAADDHLGLPDADSKALERSMEELAGPAGGLHLSNMGMSGGEGLTAADMGANLGSLPDLDLSEMGGMGMEMEMEMGMGGGGDDDWGLDFDNM